MQELIEGGIRGACHGSSAVYRSIETMLCQKSKSTALTSTILIPVSHTSDSTMTFEAYISNIQIKTGKTPENFFKAAVDQGVLRPDTKTTEFVNWLKASSGLGHGHAMAVWEAFRRNKSIPLAVASPASSRARPAPAKPAKQSNKETKK